jgi:hypothetical protein
MKTEQLTQPSEFIRNAAALDDSPLSQPPSHRIVFSISGPGFADSEEFRITDVRAARASARKLVANAIRLFGREDAAPTT